MVSHAFLAAAERPGSTNQLVLVGEILQYVARGTVSKIDRKVPRGTLVSVLELSTLVDSRLLLGTVLPRVLAVAWTGAGGLNPARKGAQCLLGVLPRSLIVFQALVAASDLDAETGPALALGGDGMLGFEYPRA